VIERAKQLAQDYAVIIERDPDDGFRGQCVELPGAMGDGASADACVASVRESIVALLATLLERKELIPPPRSAGKRTEMVNVRLSPDEKRRLERAARLKGMSGVSDFVRAAALQAS
jgi:predicted RNase H-like HicB family nuclease